MGRLGLSGADGDHVGATVALNNIQFPATAVPSADANNMDDYEEGTWTAVFTFATPGNLNVVYAAQAAHYTKKGRDVDLWWNLNASTFTHTTAAGVMKITGQPFVAKSGLDCAGHAAWGGITKAGYTEVMPIIPGGVNSQIYIFCSGSGQGWTTVDVGDVPTAGNVVSVGGLSHPV